MFINKTTIKNSIKRDLLLLETINLGNMIEKEVILLIALPLVVGVVWWYQDKRREAEKLSDRLYIAENNITYLKKFLNLNLKLKDLWLTNKRHQQVVVGLSF